MKIYFAGSIRGGRHDAELYQQIIQLLQSYGTVLTEHIGDTSLGIEGSAGTDDEIYQQDMAWLRQADLMVAEVTTTSLGVGYELGQAHALGIKTLALYRPEKNARISAMIAGNDFISLEPYTSIDDLKPLFDKYLD